MLKIYPVCKPSERKSGIFLHLDGKLLSLETSKTIASIEEFVKEVSSGESPPQEVTSQEFALVQFSQAGAPLEILRTWSASYG